MNSWWLKLNQLSQIPVNSVRILIFIKSKFKSTNTHTLPKEPMNVHKTLGSKYHKKYLFGHEEDTELPSEYTMSKNRSLLAFLRVISGILSHLSKNLKNSTKN